MICEESSICLVAAGCVVAKARRSKQNVAVGVEKPVNPMDGLRVKCVGNSSYCSRHDNDARTLPPIYWRYKLFRRVFNFPVKNI